MKQTLQGLVNSFCIVYLKNILVFLKTKKSTISIHNKYASV
jgi:hypothetical protein